MPVLSDHQCCFSWHVVAAVMHGCDSSPGASPCMRMHSDAPGLESYAPAHGLECMQVIPDLSPGFDLGAKTSDSNGYIIFNHLVFNVLINKAKGADMRAARRHRNAGDVGGARGVSGVMATVCVPCGLSCADVHTCMQT